MLYILNLQDIIELKRQQLLAKEEEARIRRQRVQEQKLRETEEKRKLVVFQSVEYILYV